MSFSTYSNHSNTPSFLITAAFVILVRPFGVDVTEHFFFPWWGVGADYAFIWLIQGTPRITQLCFRTHLLT